MSSFAPPPPRVLVFVARDGADAGVDAVPGPVLGDPVPAHGRARDLLDGAGERLVEPALRVRHGTPGDPMGARR